jgi:hypothetical protein
MMAAKLKNFSLSVETLTHDEDANTLELDT